MPDTLVIQSQRKPLPHPWLERCLDSVKQWAISNHYEYRFMGDELFDPMPNVLREKTHKQIVIATDLARLYQCQEALKRGYSSVIWCDADFLVFNPQQFIIPDYAYALGRETWIQHDKQGRLKSYVKVHNAFLLFRQNNHFLDFYAETAERLLTLNTGRMPPQFIGPKLLTALHNIARCPVLESAGMISPLVIQDIANLGGSALDLFVEQSTVEIAAANLCSSLVNKRNADNATMTQAIDNLLDRKSIVF